MIKNLEEKLRNDLNELRDKAYWIMTIEERCERIRRAREKAEEWVRKSQANQREIERKIIEYNN
jgi:hypothetical protein